ncbi:MAG: ribose-5-phosphate isomerase [Candidatus Lloydbacteria bacterium RIFCSPLOWO2_01_FULL_50_20]|uniref:Ribose-5-phosphate isomerase n=1 Tax=Candidatus Lloydbacteria bacterium RIFCSPLOWO2_01_FULL_50_20 TaxID=1798665 RepID=A0A1G2DFB4_9BACT|nr:MAG: ribose-5-phosphate isomerase [Candidatus Lloydbacteria bacterium RIFCSPHIGHO2_02_FULL_50_11]OGZ12233.1 MAG: ribose-5-phosphate isomerase [Candidatus Lloydbacteria bacterium RIFCSPLOWO2_01_FULL_50_20]
MKIYIGCDHAGYEMKEALASYLEKELDYTVLDMGAHQNDPNDDYTDFITLVAQEVSHDPDVCRGIVLGGSGQGEAIVANRFPNVRCAVFYGGTLDIVKLSRDHNNANILSLAARFLTLPEAKAAVKLWLETPFSEDERHKRRLKKLEQIWPYK